MQAMIRADEIQSGTRRMQFSMTLVETAPMTLGSSVAAAEQPSSGGPGKRSFTGSQVLAEGIAALSTVSLLLRAVIKLWLFEL
jgi:hypothetical protein